MTRMDIALPVLLHRLRHISDIRQLHTVTAPLRHIGVTFHTIINTTIYSQ